MQYRVDCVGQTASTLEVDSRLDGEIRALRRGGVVVENSIRTLALSPVSRSSNSLFGKPSSSSSLPALLTAAVPFDRGTLRALSTTAAPSPWRIVNSTMPSGTKRTSNSSSYKATIHRPKSTSSFNALPLTS